jgi:hypothetical protein
MSDKDALKDALELFKVCQEAEEQNRANALDDLKFSRLSEQWPEAVKAQRELEGRPCLTINRLPTFIRQVINDARQNKPAIKVHPADNESDPETAEIINGLIRNIEATSNADVAYDTGLDNSVTMGFGYWRVNVDYAHDDSFDKDIRIDAIANPFSVYGDPYSTKSDSSDWNMAFVVDMMTRAQFKAKYKGADASKSWDDDYKSIGAPWADGDDIQVAEYWARSEVPKVIVQLSDGMVIGADEYKANKETFELVGRKVIGERTTKSYKVVQTIMSGAEILETNDWAGIYIPIVPVYGEEINVEGKRVLKSLTRDCKDPMRMFNYWRTASTELVALAPKTPFIGKKGSFNSDAEKWATANNKSHAYIEYDGHEPPQRQPFAGPPAGALQEAMNAADDIKSVVGLYDAALGARSNEIAGVAIRERRKEGDIATFHFIDNQNRAIKHTGRIIVDLIPHVYTGSRIIRILGGEDGKKPETIRLNTPIAQEDGTARVYDLGLGKYDLTVDSGPSYATRREESVEQMMQLLQAFPQAAQLVGDLLVKNMDWPGADDIAKRLKTMLPPELQDEHGPSPEAIKLQQVQQQAEQMKQEGLHVIQQLQDQLQALQNDRAFERRKSEIDAYNAETNRLKVTTPAMSPEQIQALVMQSIMQVLNSPDVTQQIQAHQPTAA